MITVAQLKKACTGDGYILATLISGHRVGINKRVARIAQARNGSKYDRLKTPVIGWRECSLDEYISHKGLFA